MKSFYARFVLWLIRPALELRKEQVNDPLRSVFGENEEVNFISFYKPARRSLAHRFQHAFNSFLGRRQG